MLVRDKFYIGGRWVAPSSADTIEVHNAGTGAVMGRVPAGTENDIDAAVAAARGRRPPGRGERPAAGCGPSRDLPKQRKAGERVFGGERGRKFGGGGGAGRRRGRDHALE